MEKEIKSDEVVFLSISTRDDTGRVFYWRDRIFRAINHDALETVKDMFSGGMIDELVNNNLFPRSWITDCKLDGYGLVIEHERIRPVIYPYEWSFSMLKDATIAVLKVNMIARKYGYQTKDCHGFNILFDGRHPKFLDLGSFVKIEDGSACWPAYEEFKRFYYYPLFIWGNGDEHIARRMLTGGSVMPHYSYLLYRYSSLRLLGPDFLEKLTTLYYGFIKISSVSPDVIKKRFPGNFGDILVYLKLKGLLPLQSVDFPSLIRKIQKISKKSHKTPWADYHNELYDGEERLKSTPRFDRIINIIKDLKVKSVLELGGNQGVFLRLLLERTNVESAICTDYDDHAVEICYLNSKKYNNKLATANLNFMIPLALMWHESPAERFKADAVLALAVTHHLILSHNFQIDLVFKTVAAYSKKYVFIEFMPLGLWDGKTAPPVPPWYTIDWFRSSFEKYFNIILEEKVWENRVLFVGELKKSVSERADPRTNHEYHICSE